MAVGALEWAVEQWKGNALLTEQCSGSVGVGRVLEWTVLRNRHWIGSSEGGAVEWDQ